MNRFSNSILESQNNGFTQKAITSTDLPIKPKKPIPPFFKFLHEKRPELINKHTLSLKGTYIFIRMFISLCFISSNNSWL